MLTDLFLILDYYSSAFEGMPTWKTVIYFGMMLIGLISCISADHQALKTGNLEENQNTFHTLAWVSLILMLPVAGTILYWIGSVSPYENWKPETKEKIFFPYAIALKPNQLKALFICGIIGTVVKWIAGNYYHFNSISIYYGFDPVFICWLVLVLLDWKESIFRQAVFIHVLSSHNSNFSSTAPLLGIPCRQENIVANTNPTALDLVEDVNAARSAADRFFKNVPFYREQAIREKTRISVGKGRECEFIADTRSWLDKRHWPDRKLPDVVETQYVGWGVTKYIISSLEENDQIFRQRVYYRVVPRFRGWILRALLLLIILFAFFSERGGQIHLWLSQKILNLF